MHSYSMRSIALMKYMSVSIWFLVWLYQYQLITHIFAFNSYFRLYVVHSLPHILFTTIYLAILFTRIQASTQHFFHYVCSLSTSLCSEFSSFAVLLHIHSMNAFLMIISNTLYGIYIYFDSIFFCFNSLFLFLLFLRLIVSSCNPFIYWYVIVVWLCFYRKFEKQ